MSIYKQQGTIKALPPLEQGQNKKGEPWKKQVIVIGFSVEKQDGSSFDREIAVEAFNKDLPALQIGQKVDVDFTVTSREYNGKYYTNLSLMNINVAQGATPQQTPAPQQAESDGLPF